MTDRIPESDWVWCGYPGHFAGASSCRFRLHTNIGDLRVSTIGDFIDLDGSRARMGLTLTGDAYFETMVFALGPVDPVSDPHGSLIQDEDQPERAGIDLPAREYAPTAEAAEEMHARWCEWAATHATA